MSLITQNASLNGESLQVDSNVPYIIIDALYLQNISKDYLLLETASSFRLAVIKIFPYCETPLLETSFSGSMFEVSSIRQEPDQDRVDGVFSTDSGFEFDGSGDYSLQS